MKLKFRHFLFNRALRILLITNGFILTAGAMLGPIYALFVEGIGGSLLDASLTGGIFALVAGITTLIAGRYADRVKRQERVVAFGYTVMACGYVLYLFVDSIWFLFGVQALIGFAEAFYSPAFDALYSKHLIKSKAGEEWGAWESINYFTAAAGAGIGGLLASSFGFSGIFIAMAALSFGAALYIWFLPKRVL